MFILVGLGNPGEEYENTRHNAGRLALKYFVKKEKLGEFEEDKNLLSLVLRGKLKDKKVFVVLPETFMNNSGKSIKVLINKKILKVPKKKELPQFIVLHDDIDIPFGKFKISYGKSSAGHKGVESVIRVLKTKNFSRVRIGISPKRKPNQKKILNFLMGKFTPSGKKELNLIFRKISLALKTIILEDLERAM